jgi:hypothetical protein
LPFFDDLYILTTLKQRNWWWPEKGSRQRWAPKEKRDQAHAEESMTMMNHQESSSSSVLSSMKAESDNDEFDQESSRILSGAHVIAVYESSIIHPG